MTDDEVLALEACRPGLEAEATLERAYAGEIKLSPKGWFQLVLAATGDKEEAWDAHDNALIAAVKRNQPPGDTIE